MLHYGTSNDILLLKGVGSLQNELFANIIRNFYIESAAYYND
jgi:hypothetical protein